MNWGGGPGEAPRDSGLEVRLACVSIRNMRTDSTRPIWMALALGWLILVGSHGQEPSGRGLRLLYLGDSHSLGAFGERLDQRLREAGHQLHWIVASGSSPYTWLEGAAPRNGAGAYWEKTDAHEQRHEQWPDSPQLKSLLKQDRPQVVIVQTGGQLYALLRTKRETPERTLARIRGQLSEMCRQIAESGATGYWILPPRSHEARYEEALQTQLATLMKEVVGEWGGTCYESLEVTQYPGDYPAMDGIHYPPGEARQWAEGVLAHLQHALPRDRPRPREAAFSAKDAPPLGEAPPVAVGADPAPIPLKGNAPPPPVELVPEPAEARVVPIRLRLRLEAKPSLELASQVTTPRALGLYEYRVLDVLQGDYPHERIQVVQGLVFAQKLVWGATQPIGHELELELVPLSQDRDFIDWPLVGSLTAGAERPLFTPWLH